MLLLKAMASGHILLKKKKKGVWKTRECAGNTEEERALDPPGLCELPSQLGLELISRPEVRMGQRHTASMQAALNCAHRAALNTPFLQPRTA